MKGKRRIRRNEYNARTRYIQCRLKNSHAINIITSCRYRGRSMRKSYAQSFFNPFVYIYNEVQRWLRKTLYNNEAIYFRQNVTLFINSSRQRVLDFTGKSCRSFNNNLHTEQHRVTSNILMNRNANGLDENSFLIFYFFFFLT